MAPRLTLPWLLRLRWLAFLTQTVLIAAAVGAGWPAISNAVWGVVGIGVLSNVGLGLAIRGRRRVGSRALIGGVMLADVLLLTAMLALSGGPSNPFAVVFLVNVTLAAVAIGAGWTWTIVIASVAGYASLFAWPDATPHPAHEWPPHLAGMWLAFVTTAVLIALFVTGVTRTLSRREREVAALRALAARNERLASLTALAAGAAHELATPLGSIAVAAGELGRTGAAHALPSVAADAELIRSQVARCRDILDRMSGRASGKWIESRQPVQIDEIVRLLREEIGPERATRLRVEAAPGPPPIVAMRAGLVQALGSLVQNAFEASGPGASVSLGVAADAARFRFAVRDGGCGMPADVLARAGEAFFTTKAASGRGLGLFLARLFAEHQGGKLVVESAPGRGTTAVLELPAATGR